MPEDKPFHDLFVLDIQRVLGEELLKSIDQLAPTQLTPARLRDLEAIETKRVFMGLYILHYGSDVVYVGKADNSLKDRLGEHYEKLSARNCLDVSKVQFRCLYLDANWSTLAHEKFVISHFKTKNQAKWNSTGFGIHDPGRNRDGTELDDDHFDRLHPIDDSIPSPIRGREVPLSQALSLAKSGLPYLFRYQASDDYTGKTIKIPSDCSARTLLGLAVDALGGKWQLSILHGYIILYKEHKDYSIKSCQRFKRGGLKWTELT